jgi:hypothetical protein
MELQSPQTQRQKRDMGRQSPKPPKLTEVTRKLKSFKIKNTNISREFNLSIRVANERKTWRFQINRNLPWVQ